MENNNMRGIWKLTALFVLAAVAIIAIGTTLSQGAEMRKINDRVAVYQGEMVKGDVQRFTDYMKANPNTKTLYMNSPGGLVSVGTRLGNVFSSNDDLIVAVAESDKCVSACAFAFLGANKQIINGKLAFHRAWTENRNKSVNEVFGEGQLAGGYLLYYVMDKGYNSQLMYLISSQTDRSTFIVFDNSEQLGNFFISVDKDTPVGEFLAPAGFSPEWLKQAIRKGSEL